LSSYIAKSKIDGEREQLTESGVRPLFSAHQDKLTLKEADHTLNPTGRELEKEEVIHVVISPERGSLDRDVDDPAEKQKTVRETIRAAIRVMERILNVKSLCWIAGFHENTKTPHVHVAVSRWALDAVTQKLRYIKHLPKSLLPHNTEGAGGERRFLAGKIAEVFISALVQKLKPIRSVQIIDTLHGINVNRSVASRYAQMLRAPTPEQLAVGQWLESALMLATGRMGELSRDELLKQYSELTSQVARIDALARANGARPPVAYIAPERLEELVNGKAPNVQITVSSTQPRVQDEKYVSINTEQVPVASSEQLAKVETTQHENDKALSLPHQQGEDRKSSQQAPERVAKGRESNPERQEPKQIERPQAQKTREPIKDQSNVKSEEPRVGKFTLLDLHNQIQQRNGGREKPETSPASIPQLSTLAVAKAQNTDSKAGADTAAQINSPSHAMIEPMSKAIDDTSNSTLEEAHEWEIDDEDLIWMAGVTFVNLHQQQKYAKERSVKEGTKESTSYESNNYFSPSTMREEVTFREAEILNKVYLAACLERKLTPNVEGVTRYLMAQARTSQGPVVPLMEEMNTVRESIEEVVTPTNHRLVDEFHRLHEVHPWLTPNVEYSHDIDEIHEPSNRNGTNDQRHEHGAPERVLDLENHTHDH
jgi:hypothetical protein